MPARKLTARFVETVKAENDRLEIRDTAVQGLELRVSKAGGKMWALRYRRQSDGAKRTVTLGAFPDFSLDDAREWAEDRRREIARGEDPAAKRAARKEAPTFAELANEWVEGHGKPNVSARALADYQSMLERHIKPEIGSMKAADVRKRDVVALLGAVKAKGDARAKLQKKARRMTHRPNRVFELVRAIYRWGVGQDIVQADPTIGVKAPIKKEKARERVLMPAELQKLLAALEAAPAERRQRRDGAGSGKFRKAVGAGEIKMSRTTALAIQVSAVTGQRIGEVSGMAAAELNLNDTAPLWVIPGERTKNGLPQRVPLSPLAVKKIREAMGVTQYLCGESRWVFANADDGEAHISPAAATKALERSRDALGIDRFNIHDLRRTAATGMAELGVNPYTVSLVLNHESVRRGTVTGRVYDQYSYDREKREALEKWGARVEAIIAGADGTNVVAFPAAKVAEKSPVA